MYQDIVEMTPATFPAACFCQEHAPTSTEGIQITGQGAHDTSHPHSPMDIV
jgi:hypothetical protein